MTKTKVFFAVLVLLMLALPSTALAEPKPVIWWAEYFDNPHLKGNPIRSIREEKIDHDWGYESPLVAVPHDYFSVRWSTDAHFEEGQYTFTVTADDGVRLWIDGKLVIDQWRVQKASTYTHSIYFHAGQHKLQMAYFEQTHAAVAKLWWRKDAKPERKAKPSHPPKQHKPHHPHPSGPHSGGAIVVDNKGPGFKWGGSTDYRHASTGGYGTGFFWTKNTERYPTNHALWWPYIERAGKYEVFVFIPGNHATTEKARYRILHNGERHDKFVDQAWYFNQWVSLGTYYFSGHGHEYVALYDNTREANYSTRIAFDAVKWVPVH